jgi:hypothetical protein
MDVTFPDHQTETNFAPQPYETSPPGAQEAD